MKRLLFLSLALASAGAFAFDWSGKTGDVDLTGETSVDITDADVAIVNALDSLTIPAGVTVNLKNTTNCLEFDGTPALSGAGTVYGTAQAKANFSGDNRGFTGKYDFRASWITVTHEYGLGEATVNFVSAGYGKTTSRLRFSGDGLTCHATVTVAGFMDKSEQKMTSGSDLMTFKKPFTTAGSDTIYLPHAVFDSTFTVSSAHNLSFAYDVTFNGAANLTKMGGDKNFWVIAGVTVTFNATGNSWANPSCKFCTDGTVRFAKAGAFYSGANFKTMQGTSDKPVIDLDGHDAYATYIFNYATPAASWSGYPTVTSATPCTFTMNANGSYAAIVKFSGKVSHVHDGSGTYTMYNAYSDTTGTLSIPKGGVKLDWNAGWGGDVSIASGAKLVMTEGTSLNSEGWSMIVAADGAQIQLDEGMSISCSNLTYRGVSYAEGTYGQTELPDLLTTGGSIVVSVPPAVWTGKGTGWADPASWNTGAVPAADATVVIPSGLTAPVYDADVATVGALGEIVVNGALKFSNATAPLNVKADLSGTGAISGLNAGSGYNPTSGVTLSGDNRSHTGSMWFSNTAVCVTSRYGLGSASRRVTHACGLLKFEGDGLTNDAPLYIFGDHTVGTYKPFKDGDVELVLNGDVLFNAWPSAIRYSLNGVTFNGAVSYDGTRGVEYWISGTNVFNKTLYAGAQNHHIFYLEAATSVVHVKARYGFWAGTTVCGPGLYVCDGPDALCAERTLTLGYNSNYPAGHVDLDGHDQQVGALVTYQTTYKSGVATIASDSPAQVFLMTPETTSTYRIDFLGQAGLGFGAPYLGSATAGTITLASVSTTTGLLSTDNGSTVNLAANAAWYGDLSIDANGWISLAAGATLNPDGTSKVTIAAGGVLEVADTVSVAELTVGGEKKNPGLYTAAKLPGSLAGAGAVLVLPASEKGKTHTWKGTVDGDISKADNWDAEGVPATDGSAEIVIGADAANAMTVPSDGLAIYGLRFEQAAGTTISGGELMIGKGGLAMTNPSADAGSVVTNTIDADISLSHFPDGGQTWTLGTNTYFVINGAIAGGTAADRLTITTPDVSNTVEGVTLTGDNRSLLAPLDLTEIAVRSGHEYALGASSRATSYTRVIGRSGRSQLKFFGDGLTNATPLVVRTVDSGSVPASGFHDNSADPLVFRGKVRFIPWDYENEWIYVAIGADDRYEGGVTAEATYGGSIRFTGEAVASSHLTITGSPLKGSNATVEFIRLTATVETAQNEFRQIFFYEGAKLICGTSGVLNAANGYNQIAFGNGTDTGAGSIDLGSLDQPFSTIYYNNSNKFNGNGTVHSAADAYLKCIRSDRSGTQAQVNAVFTGKAGFWQNGTVSNTFNGVVSPTTGRLRVTKGGLILKDAFFPNASAVLVDGGILYVRNAARARNTFGISTDLAITSGSVEITEGAVRVKSLTVGGSAKEAGYYGASDCTDPRVPAANRLSCLTGAGVLRVGTKGFAVILK